MFEIFEDGNQVGSTLFQGHRNEGFYSFIGGSREFPTLESALSLFDREFMRHGAIEIKQGGEVVKTVAVRHDNYSKFPAQRRQY